MFFKRFFGHLNTVNKHRWNVFKLCVKVGLPIRGLLHDLSKYSWAEFFEGVKYYTDGKISPIKTCKKINGYSKAWLHHKGRNKHHFEYWYDFNTPNPTPIIPFKYLVELMCDNIAAHLTYNGKNASFDAQLKYFLNRRDLMYINEDIKKVIIEVYKKLAKEGLSKTLNKKNLKKTYFKYINS